MPDRDDDSTRPYSRTPSRAECAPAHDCSQRGAIRDLQRRVEKHDERLGEGAVTMATLSASVLALKESVDKLTALVSESQKQSPIVGKIIDAAITWAVPAGIIVIVWALVSSGVVSVPQRQQEQQQRSTGQ